MIIWTIRFIKPTKAAQKAAETIKGKPLFSTVTGKVFRGKNVHITPKGAVYSYTYTTKNSVKLTVKRPKTR